MARGGSERRQFVRVSDEVVSAITPHGAVQPQAARTLNFSLGGVLLTSPTRLDIGTDVDVSLRIDDEGEERLLEFTARVVRVRSLSNRYHELALEFADGSPADQHALQQLIADRLAPDPLAPRSA